jgi:hypothetical protein
MVHRRGKKHLEAANKRMKEKEWELQKRQKEEQEDSLKTSSYENTRTCDGVQRASTLPLLEMTRKRTGHALLKEAPYNSTAARKRIKLPDRQPFFFQQQSQDVSLGREINKQPGTENREQNTSGQSCQASTSKYVFPWNAGVSRRAQRNKNSHSNVVHKGDKQKEHLHYIQLKQ